MAKRKKDNGANSRALQNGAKLGFGEKLWAAADKLRGHEKENEMGAHFFF